MEDRIIMVKVNLSRKRLKSLKSTVPRAPGTYYNCTTPGGNGRPNKSEIAKESVVSRKFVYKIEAELMECGRVVDPRFIEWYYAVGPPAKTMDSLDGFACNLQLYYLQEPSRTLPSYCKLLY
jgi:hypothetical protein